MSNVDRGLGKQKFSRTAERLVKTRKIGAAAYVEMKIKGMELIGDEENQTYWENVLKEVEKLLYEA